MNELKITQSDWFSVFITGTLFSAFLSMLAYYLLNMKLFDGFVFGVVLGFFIALYSLLFVTSMNHYLLPYMPKSTWNAIAAFFSYLSGFFGTFSTYTVFVLLPIPTVELFQAHPLPSSSIIGVLSYLMGALMYRFVKARNEKEEKEQLFIQSRLRSLETQLNPHFLFNALNSLSELVHQNPTKAEEMIVKLSYFLRNTMGEKTLISLADEIQNVHDYIDLESLRFPSLRLTTEIATDTLTHKVPKFSIQLLVENAIKHGYDPALETFEIFIRSFADPKLTLHVSNNGKSVSSKRFGIGLSNLQERIAFLCGGDVTLESSHNPTTYQITLKGCNENTDRR
ncbi:MAG: histidine kinase [Sulfuricurvum sp.]|nr:histidine kinase [Sulfuricurvum sp.]